MCCKVLAVEVENGKRIKDVVPHCSQPEPLRRHNAEFWYHINITFEKSFGQCEPCGDSDWLLPHPGPDQRCCRHWNIHEWVACTALLTSSRRGRRKWMRRRRRHFPPIAPLERLLPSSDKQEHHKVSELLQDLLWVSGGHCNPSVTIYQQHANSRQPIRWEQEHHADPLMISC